MARRAFTAPAQSDRCVQNVTLDDGSGAQCMHKRSSLCAQHFRIAEGDAGDAAALTFEVAERIAQFITDHAASDGKHHSLSVMDAMSDIAFRIRTNEWREGWDRDPARKETP